ncbi:TPA: hypothetical protein ACGW54_003943 [Bacillus tropicus]
MEIDRLTNSSDGIDYIVAVGSGILAGIVDSLWVGEFKIEQGKAWSDMSVNDFVMKVARPKDFADLTMQNIIEVIRGGYKFAYLGSPDGIVQIFYIPNVVQSKGENL